MKLRTVTSGLKIGEPVTWWSLTALRLQLRMNSCCLMQGALFAASDVLLRVCPFPFWPPYWLPSVLLPSDLLPAVGRRTSPVAACC
ncbi:MAG: hypothetical protein MZV63_60695 [Marinilabiliales bacterium]|nr:hypothetical protein [Marinilabiliales bacterium]